MQIAKWYDQLPANFSDFLKRCSFLSFSEKCQLFEYLGKAVQDYDHILTKKLIDSLEMVCTFDGDFSDGKYKEHEQLWTLLINEYLKISDNLKKTDEFKFKITNLQLLNGFKAMIEFIPEEHKIFYQNKNFLITLKEKA